MQPAVVSEYSELEVIADGPAWAPEDGALLVVAPHPNDEILRYAIWAWQAAEQLREARWGKFLLGDDALRAKTGALGCFRTQLEGCDAGLLFKPYEAFLL